MTFEDENDFLKLDRDFEDETAALFSLPINIPGTAYNRGLQAARRIRALLTQRLRDETKRYSEAGSMPVDTDPVASQTKKRPLRNAIEAIVELQSSAEQDVKDAVLDEEHVVNNLLLLLEAAHGTTMYASTALLGELHKPENKEALDKLRAEMCNCTKEAPTVEDLTRMEFAEACINEALRLYPFAGGVPKTLPANQTLEVGGKVVTGPMDVMLYFSHAFDDPQMFPEVRAFRPERWLPDARASLQVSDDARLAFTPFGMGSHICLGMNLARLTMKTVLFTYCTGGYDLELMGPVERVGRILPEVIVKNGVRARVSQGARPQMRA
eukprot:gnl/TRDRNA2_/TRDRNA2_93383_c1_seq1.p1 gnl/TRDRNA2_/TRDRNA2_93383_c1~~gnl/TRDRNA2_/TRDRNA2_93383_c1_seq1.p1  ORF type:complete len:342 (-),score=68.25 gnl/TRDRNA2_/TRDRNA2_93383_c1_seq1:270-1244(-)